MIQCQWVGLLNWTGSCVCVFTSRWYIFAQPPNMEANTDCWLGSYASLWQWRVSREKSVVQRSGIHMYVCISRNMSDLEISDLGQFKQPSRTGACWMIQLLLAVHVKHFTDCYDATPYERKTVRGLINNRLYFNITAAYSLRIRHLMEGQITSCLRATRKYV